MIGGNSAYVAITFNYGVTWTKRTMPTAYTSGSYSCKFHGISMLNPTTAYVAGSSGTPNALLYLTLDGGLSWILQSSQSSLVFYGVSMYSLSVGVTLCSSNKLFVQVSGLFSF